MAGYAGVVADFRFLKRCFLLFAVERHFLMCFRQSVFIIVAAEAIVFLIRMQRCGAGCVVLALCGGLLAAARLDPDRSFTLRG